MNPFIGLRPFESGDSLYYFGREEQTKALLRQLHATRFLAVVGSSGSGKSSLVQAGLIPNLEAGFLVQDRDLWKIAKMKPGDTPLLNLIRTILTALGVIKTDKVTNTLEGHSDSVRSVAFSPDGKTLASGPSDNTIKLWDIETGKVTNTLEGHSDSVISVVFSPDGKTLASGSSDNTIKLWDLGNLLEIESLKREVSRKGAGAIVERVTAAFNGNEKDDYNMLLLVDQFEELFRFHFDKTSKADYEKSTDFVDILLRLVAQTEVPIYVCITMRSDFFGDCDNFHGLPEAMNRSQYLVPRLTRKQRRTAIAGPIHLSGTSITPQLLDRLLNETMDTRDDLPVLQHVLMRTWAEWASKGKNRIDQTHYDTVHTVRKALNNHANEVLRELNDQEKEISKVIFQTITETDAGNRRIRRPAHLKEIIAISKSSTEDVMKIINKFREGGRNFLVLSSEDPDDNPIVDISHESLIRQWQTLTEWVDEEAKAARIYKRLVQTSELHAQHQAGLYGEADIQILLKWQQELKPTEVWGKKYHGDFHTALDFLKRSNHAVQEDKRKKQNQREEEKHRQREEEKRLLEKKARQQRIHAFQTEIRAIRSIRDEEEKKQRVLELCERVTNATVNIPEVALELLTLVHDVLGLDELLKYAKTLPPALQKRPDIAEQVLVAQSAQEQGDHKKAIAGLEELMKQFGESVERWGLVGGRYKRLYREGRESRRESGEGEPNLQELGYLDEAIEAYKKGMELDYNEYFCVCNLPTLLRDRGEEGDMEEADFLDKLTSRICSRDIIRGEDDGWVKATLLVVAFRSQDITLVRKMAMKMVEQGATVWELKTVLEDIDDTLHHIKDPIVNSALTKVRDDLHRLAEHRYLKP